MKEAPSYEVQSYYVSYIKEYIKLLTGGKEEFFLSLCDIEEELLQQLDVSSLTDYHVVLVDNKDYSEAVRLRNDIRVKRIVLLSGEGIKQIDSLKDFNEYSILSRDRTLLWNCLERIFPVRLKANEKVFFETILSQREISFWDFLQYLCSAGIQEGQIVPRQLNENLSKLGIWKSRSDRILTKAKVRKMIQLSRYGTIENRLTNAVLNNKNIDKLSPSDVQLITRSLAREDITRILNNIYYEQVEDSLKYLPRNTPGSGSAPNGTEESPVSETNDCFSYEFLLQEHSAMEITALENEWLMEKETEEASIELNWDKYYTPENDKVKYLRQFETLQQQIKTLNIPPHKINEIIKRLGSLQSAFEDAWDNVIKATPICLDTFCRASEKYMRIYFELLAFLMTDEKIKYAMIETGIIPGLQTLFCEMETGRIEMPFYHPVCVFYYMGIQRMYEYTIQKQRESDDLKIDVLEALIPKLGMQFPIDFFELDEQDYALDYTTIWKKRNVVFHNMEDGVVYSVLDFRAVQKQIMEYIEAHPFLTEITVALIDISDLGGLLQLIDRIRQVSQGKYCNIGHITFFILSAKEDDLKKALSQIWDTIGTDDIVRFRFDRNNYSCRTQNNKFQYDIQKIVDESDLTIIADGTMLYHEPRMVKIQTGGNMIYNRIAQIDMTEQLDHYFESGRSDIPILWDTLQRIAGSREDGLWTRKSKEIDNRILSFINQTVSQNPDKRIVALSSNEHILSEIFRIDYMHAFRQKYNGKSITIIQFDHANQVHHIPMKGNFEIVYSLNDFYNMTLELENFSQKILPDIHDILLQIYYEDGKYFCNCNIYMEEPDENTDTYQQNCGAFLRWQMSTFLSENNILSLYLYELLINQWSEKAESIPAVLMVESLREGYTIRPCYITKRTEETDGNSRIQLESDRMEAIKIHEMLLFTRRKEVIDEYTVSQFQEQFDDSLLNRVIKCDNAQPILNTKEKEKLSEIQKRIKEN